MSEGRKSEMTVRIEMVVADLVSKIEALVEVWQLPPGMEEISIRELWRRWPNMAQDERDAMMRRSDWPEIQAAMLRGD